jgi:hypothetical protein
MSLIQMILIDMFTLKLIIIVVGEVKGMFSKISKK